MASKETTRRMAGPDGELYDIPYSAVEQAHKDGLEFTTDMVDPKDSNKTYAIPNSKIEEARNDGLSDFDAPPTLTTPYESKLHADEVQTREDGKSFATKAKEGFEDEFLSGGAQDIRNIPVALGPMAEIPAGVGMLLGKGAASASNLWNAVTKSRAGTQALTRTSSIVDTAGSPIVRSAKAGEIASSALKGTKDVAAAVGGATKKKVVSLGKWLANAAGAGAAGYGGAKAYDEVKELKE